ncbi:MAG: hypothetical protein HOV81_11920 [Kofleriaceae bacterium]|nr:hypothetical protein [Kofleriaceae bacterium]
MANTMQTRTSADLKQRLQTRLDEARQRLDGVQKDLQNLREEDKESVRAKAAEIRKRIDEHQQKATELKTQAAEWLKEKKEQTEDAISSWRQKLEIKRLIHRAERAEDYAVNAVAVAIMDIQNAEMAMLEALEARLDVEAGAAT